MTNGLSADFCDNARPIYMDAHDKVTADTARQILEYDDKGHALCAWPYSR